MAGLVELAVVGDSAAAEAYPRQHSDADAEGFQLTVDLQNLLWQIRRRGTVRPESIYRVGEEVFALLVNDEGLRWTDQRVAPFHLADRRYRVE